MVPEVLMGGNKSRLLRLYRYLYLNTDDKHFTTKQEIMDAVREEGEIYSRQTVRDDIDTLSKEGYDIETVVSSGNYYYFRDREFTLDELKLISDAVASYRFIGKKQKEALTGKLKKFCSRFQAGTIRRHLVSVESPQSGDARVYEIVNTINDAVNQGRRISYRYKEETVICTPLDLIWDGRDFYLAAVLKGGGGPEIFEVRCIFSLFILEEGADERPAGFNAEKFALEMLEKQAPGAGRGC